MLTDGFRRRRKPIEDQVRHKHGGTASFCSRLFINMNQRYGCVDVTVSFRFGVFDNTVLLVLRQFSRVGFSTKVELQIVLCRCDGHFQGPGSTRTLLIQIVLCGCDNNFLGPSSTRTLLHIILCGADVNLCAERKLGITCVLQTNVDMRKVGFMST